MASDSVDQRKSEPLKAPLITDPDEVASREAENGLRQISFVLETVENVVGSEENFLLRPSLLNKLNRLAIEGLSELPGTYRPGPMKIRHSNHEPPPPEDVPELMEEMCEYVNANWQKDAWHLAAYLMWRLNWIHPFEDGNGRTSRAISYLILCIRLGFKLPGEKTIPDFIADNKSSYYQAIDAADAAALKGQIDVSEMEIVLKDVAAAQLASFHDEITGGHLSGLTLPAQKDASQAPRRLSEKLHEAYRKYPLWFWLGGIIIPLGISFLFI